MVHDRKTIFNTQVFVLIIGALLCFERTRFEIDFESTVNTQVTYGKGPLINMQKLVLGAYLPDFTS